MDKNKAQVVCVHVITALLSGVKTYCSGPWVGNLAHVLGPLIIVPVFVGKRSVEDIADVGHGVDADG